MTALWTANMFNLTILMSWHPLIRTLSMAPSVNLHPRRPRGALGSPRMVNLPPWKDYKADISKASLSSQKIKDCGLGLVYILNGGATLLVGTSVSLNRLRAVSLFKRNARGGKQKKKTDCSQCRTSMKAGIHLGSYIAQPIGLSPTPPRPPPPVIWSTLWQGTLNSEAANLLTGTGLASKSLGTPPRKRLSSGYML